MANKSWESGAKFSRLMSTGKSYVKGKHRFVEFICECNTVKFIRFDGVISGIVASCGCLHREVAKKTLTTHGLSSHPLYHTHEDMKARCLNTNSASFSTYGARGIIICEEWKNDFKSFLDWALSQGWVYKRRLTLDRINNDGNYEPTNCRFATDFVQSRNKRSTVNLTAFGETKCATDWMKDERCIISIGLLRKRLKDKWEHEKALTFPSRNKNKRKRLSP